MDRQAILLSEVGAAVSMGRSGIYREECYALAHKSSLGSCERLFFRTSTISQSRDPENKPKSRKLQACLCLHEVNKDLTN